MTLRSHAGEVQALLFLDYLGSPLLLSGASDGTVAAWDARFSTQLLAWTAHTGGLLALRAAPLGPAHFFSHGRDGCVHAWQWKGAAALAGSDGGGGPRDELEEQLAALAGAAGGGGSGGSAPLQLPTRLFTLRVGFGGFCGMSLLAVGGAAAAPLQRARREGGGGGGSGHHGLSLREIEAREEEEEEVGEANVGAGEAQPLLLAAAPSLDAASIELFDCRGEGAGGLVARARMCEADASAATAALLEGTADARPQLAPGEKEEDEGSALADLRKRPGMPTCLALLPASGAGWGCGNGSGGGAAPESAAAPAQQTPSPLSIAAAAELVAARFTCPDGAPRHPEAPGGGGLRELLLQGAAVGGVDATPSSPPPLAAAPFPALVVASFESGSIFVLRAVLLDEGEEAAAAAAAEAAEAEHGELPPLPLLPAPPPRALILLPLSRHAILTFSLAGEAPALLGVAATTGPLLYTFSLDLAARTGARLRAILMPSAGASCSAALPPLLAARGEGGARFLVGCWDGCVRLVEAGGGSGAAARCAVVAATGTGVYSVAVGLGGTAGGLAMAAGAKDGRVLLQGFEALRELALG